MSEAERIAKIINSELPRLKSGSLRFWGEWFGRPHDNFHRIVGCEAKQDNLQIKFNEDEVLYVEAPKNWTISESIFKIEDATHVRWEWYYYGRSKTKSNLYFMDFRNNQKIIESSTNIDWYTPELKALLKEPAIEIFS